MIGRWMAAKIACRIRKSVELSVCRWVWRWAVRPAPGTFCWLAPSLVRRTQSGSSGSAEERVKTGCNRSINRKMRSVAWPLFSLDLLQWNFNLLQKSMEDPHSKILDVPPPLGSNFLHSHAVFRQICLDNRLAPFPFEFGARYSGKPWIRHWMFMLQ